QDFVSIRDGEQVPLRIDGESHNMTKLGFWPFDKPNRCGISVGVPAKYVDASSRQTGDENLLIPQIQTDGVRRYQKRVWPFDDAQPIPPPRPPPPPAQHPTPPPAPHHHPPTPRPAPTPPTPPPPYSILPRDHPP